MLLGPARSRNRRHRMRSITFAFITICLGLVFVLPATAHLTEEEQQNRDFVMEFWRVVLQAGHLDRAGEYYAVDMIQHNPNVPQGLAGFVEFFSRLNLSRRKFSPRFRTWWRLPWRMTWSPSYGERMLRIPRTVPGLTMPSILILSVFGTARSSNTGTPPVDPHQNKFQAREILR